MLDRIPVNKALIPYSFEITLGGTVFTLRWDYNAEADLFTVSLFTDASLVCGGEPVVYGAPLFQDVYAAGKFPCLAVVPLDESGQADRVTWGNFNRTVYLCVDDGEGVNHL